MTDDLRLLRCPVTRSGLRPLDADEIAEGNRRLSEGRLRHLDGTPVQRMLQAGLASEDGSIAHRIDDGIVVLLPSLAIALADVHRDHDETLRNAKARVQAFYDEAGWRRGDAGQFEDALQFEDLRPVARTYVRKGHLRVRRHLKEPGTYLVDVASGPIQYPEYLTYSERFEKRICVDISLVALREARHTLGDRGIYLLADITNLPISDDQVDGVVSLHTIYHVPEDEQAEAFREIHRILRPGASAVVVYSWGSHSGLMKAALRPYNAIRRAGRMLLGRRWEGRSDLGGPVNAGYAYMHDYDWFVAQPWPFRWNVLVWRSVSVDFLRTYIGCGILGRLALHVIYSLEERFPRLSGRHGQYPMIVIEK